MNQAETPIFAQDLKRLLGITHSNTLRIMIKAGKVPPPDVQLSQKTRYWLPGSLVKAGLLTDRNMEHASP